MTGYSSFDACRTDKHNAGTVEIILLDDDDAGSAETRNKEADIIAKRINSLIDDFRLTERADSHGAGSRPCRYMDIALLLRKRTHLKKYEEAFRRHNIPFVAVKGTGFYQEPDRIGGSNSDNTDRVICSLGKGIDPGDLHWYTFCVVERSIINLAVTAEGQVNLYLLGQAVKLR